MDKRKIDKIRESGGQAYVGKKEDGGVIDMITIGDKLLAIKENSIYEMISADKVDPERTTEAIPNYIQRKILDKGPSSDVVAKSLLTAKSLFQKGSFTKNQIEKILSLSLEGMIELDNLDNEINTYLELENEQNSNYEESEKKSDNYIIPSIPNVETICKTIFQKADQIEQVIMEMVVEFYPHKRLTKQSHFPNMKEKLKEQYGEEDNAIIYLEGIVELMEIIRNIRNGLDHRLPTVKVIDYEVQSDSNIAYPTIELKHKQFKLDRIHLNEFLPFIMRRLANIFENMLAIIADKNIKEPNVLTFQVREKPMETGKYRKVKYALWSPAGKDGFYNLN